MVHVEGPSGAADLEMASGRGPMRETAKATIKVLYERLAEPLDIDPPEFAAMDKRIRDEAAKIGLADLEEAVADIERRETEMSGRGSNLDLKRVLMELGNELVTKHGYQPVGSLPDDFVRNVEADNSTGFLTTLTIWLNARPEAQEILKKMGVAWPVVRGRGGR